MKLRNRQAARCAAPTLIATAVALLAVSCAHGAVGPGVASIGSAGSGASSPTSASSTSLSADDAKLAFARCMRTHGVADFPDPGSKVSSGSGGELNPYDPTFEAGYQACRALLPPGQETLEQMHRQLADEGLSFARCMRAHGIAGFPDPDADGQLPEARMRGLGKGSPQFTAAQNACQHTLDHFGGGG